MAQIAELPLGMRLFLRAYRWRRIDPVPVARLARSLAESCLALVSSAGFVLPEQEPFDSGVRGGDPSFRRIPSDADVRSLVCTHRSEAFDPRGLREDRNLAFPLDRLRELEAEGKIGRLAPFHLSFMGGITAPGRLVRRTAPEAARSLVEAGAEAALLVPV